jgi:hypothetical protein
MAFVRSADLLLGRASIQTRERYLRTEPELAIAVHALEMD